MAVNPYLKQFSKLTTKELSKKFTKTIPEFWQYQGQKMVLELFHKTSELVPAYRHFLKKNKIKPSLIKTAKDLRFVPPCDKNNYIKQYPLEALAWQGKLENNTLISVSSGSSGQPFFWPRSNGLENETALIHKFILTNYFETDTTPTLFINTFAMGIYIAGIITLTSVLRMAEKKYPISIISPGINIEDTLRSVKELSSKYSQTIIAGYPPFVKDILDKGSQQRINWKKYNVKFLFATESFSEHWREYILHKAGKLMPENRFSNSINIYGSAEAGILGHETPLSNWIRHRTLKNPALAASLFDKSARMPTIVQYYPMFKFYEQYNNELLFSTYGGLPLVRYNIKDTGRIITFSEMNNLLKQTGLAVEIPQSQIWKLPFIEVFGKSDNTVTFYGVNIYPENIKTALEHKNIFNHLTGKFIVKTENNKKQNPYMKIWIELKEGKRVPENLTEKINKIIIKSLSKSNSEYKRLRESVGKKTDPIIQLVEYGNPIHSPRNIKHRYK